MFRRLSPTLRLWLLCCLIAALPLQGQAAMSLRACLGSLDAPVVGAGLSMVSTPAHAMSVGSAPAGPTAHDHPHHAMAEADAAFDHHAAHGGHAGTPSPVIDLRHDAGPHTAGQHAAGKCSVCAACGVALAIGEMPVVPSTLPAGTEPPPRRTLARCSFETAAPERPPRSARL